MFETSTKVDIGRKPQNDVLSQLGVDLAVNLSCMTIEDINWDTNIHPLSLFVHVNLIKYISMAVDY